MGGCRGGGGRGGEADGCCHRRGGSHGVGRQRRHRRRHWHHRRALRRSAESARRRRPGRSPTGAHRRRRAESPARTHREHRSTGPPAARGRLSERPGGRGGGPSLQARCNLRDPVLGCTNPPSGHRRRRRRRRGRGRRRRPAQHRPPLGSRRWRRRGRSRPAVQRRPESPASRGGPFGATRRRHRLGSLSLGHGSRDAPAPDQVVADLEMLSRHPRGIPVHRRSAGPSVSPGPEPTRHLGSEAGGLRSRRGRTGRTDRRAAHRIDKGPLAGRTGGSPVVPTPAAGADELIRHLGPHDEPRALQLPGLSRGRHSLRQRRSVDGRAVRSRRMVTAFLIIVCAPGAISRLGQAHMAIRSYGCSDEKAAVDMGVDRTLPPHPPPPP